MDGKEVKDDVGVSCRKRGVKSDKTFEASAIASWLELWQLILCVDFRRTCALRLQTKDWICKIIYTPLSSTIYNLETEMETSCS